MSGAEQCKNGGRQRLMCVERDRTIGRENTMDAVRCCDPYPETQQTAEHETRE